MNNSQLNPLIEQVLTELTQEIISNYIPHKRVSDDNPFDSSGSVSEIKTIDEYEEFIVENCENYNEMIYHSKSEALFSEVRINTSVATYVSGYGLHWLSYKDLIKDKFNDFKIENFVFFDDDGDYLSEMEELDIEIEVCVERYFINLDYEYYADLIRRTIGECYEAV